MVEPTARGDNNRILNAFLCCIYTVEETSDGNDSNNGRSTILTSTQEEKKTEPLIPTSAPKAEDVEIKDMNVTNSNKEHKQQDVKIDDDSGNEIICRYCFSGEGEFISPCKCSGSQKWVHRECLRKWQMSCLVRRSTHPWYRQQTNPEKFCNVCVSKFDPDPPNYNELVRGVTGDQVVEQIREGFLIVATIESSEQSEAILLVNEQVRNILGPWIRGVYLIIDISPGMIGQMVTAVNLTKELTRPPPHFSSFVRRFRHKKILVKWMDAGPCRGLHGVGCLRATSREQVEQETRLNILDDTPQGLTVAGAFEVVVEMCDKDWFKEKSLCWRNFENLQSISEPPLREVYACCGDGTWTRAQLIGEIARGSWGMAPFKTNDVFKVPNMAEPPAPDEIYMMLQNENRPIAPEEKMIEAFDEALDPTPFEDTAEARQHREELRKQLSARSRPSSAITSEPVSPNNEVHITIEADPVDIGAVESKENINFEPSQLVLIESEESAELTRGFDI